MGVLELVQLRKIDLLFRTNLSANSNPRNQEKKEDKICM